MLFWVYIRVRQFLAVLILGRDCWHCPTKLLFEGLCIFPLVTPSDLGRVRLRYDYMALTCQCMRNLAWAWYYYCVHVNVYSYVNLWLHKLASLQSLRGNTGCSTEYHYLICQLLLSVEECTHDSARIICPQAHRLALEFRSNLYLSKPAEDWRSCLLPVISVPSYSVLFWE